MNWKTVVPLVVALCLGTVAAVVGRNMLVKGRQGGGAAVGLTRVVVAREDLQPGAVIREADVAVREVAAAGLPAGLTFRDAAEVVGRVVTTHVVKDQAVLATLLASKGSGGGLQAMVPAGMRAVTLEVNEFSGLGGLLAPGARVDVVQTIEAKGDGSGGKVARTIVENLRVLAVGRRMSAPTPGVAGEGETGLAKSVTLLATAAQAEAIDLASHVGVPRLVMRNGLDERVVGGPGMTVAELLGGRSGSGGLEVAKALVEWFRSAAPAATRPVERVRQPAVAARPNYREVEVIRGGAVTSVRVTGEVRGNSDVAGGGDELEGVVPAER